MKKSLVLAMAMALGVTASAYAANPFSDVPAGHWAYSSVAQLAAAGVVQGYGDTTFGGDKLMTRYEMAEIVAKAMAKGANVDQLAAEFASELNQLGVRVAKLEKKSDNVKVSGEFRAHYKKMKASINGASYESVLRSRIMLQGQINSGWTYNAMLQNEQELHSGAKNSGEEKVYFKRAFVEGKVGGINVRAGRQDYAWGDGDVLDDDATSDAVVLSYGNKVKVEGVVAQLSETDDPADGAKYYGAKVEFAPTENFALKGEYVKFEDTGSVKGDTAKIYTAGLTYGMGDVELTGLFSRGQYKSGSIKPSDDRNGYVIGLSYKGAEAEEAGSWGLYAKYYNQGWQSYTPMHAGDGTWFEGHGVKGWMVGGNVAMAKNIVANVAYYDTKDKLTSDKDHVLWSDVTFSF